MPSYILEADFGIETDRLKMNTLSYDFGENKFHNHGDFRERTMDYDLALRTFNERPEKEYARRYRLVEERYNEKTDEVDVIVLMEADNPVP